MKGEKAQAINNVWNRLFDCYIYLKGYFWFRVLLITFSFTTVIDIVTDYLALIEFASAKQKWWTWICFFALYYSNRLGFYRWSRANYRMKDFRMFANMTEMKLDWTLLVHATPVIGPIVDMFYLHHDGWESRADSIPAALWLCMETEIVLTCFSWLYLLVVFYEIYDLIPTYWEDLRFNPRSDPPADLIVIPALELFEAFPQICVQFRAYLDPDFDMNDMIFVLSAIFSIIGVIKATFMFVYHYPRMRLKQGVYKVASELDFSARHFTEFPAVDGDLNKIKVLFLGENAGFDVLTILPMPALQSLRLNDCRIRSLSPNDYFLSLANVSKIAGDGKEKKVARVNVRSMCFSERFPMLKSFDLSGNFGFDPDTLPTMPLLNKLSLTNCDLTTLGKKSWVTRFPRLELLEIYNNPKLNSLESLQTLRQETGTLLELDKEQTILPGFQIENYGAPEILETNIHHL